MAKLYLSATTDMIKTLRTARGRDFIDVNLHFDDRFYSKTINIELHRVDDAIRILTINGKKACEIDRYNGIMVCDLKGEYDYVKDVWVD